MRRTRSTVRMEEAISKLESMAFRARLKNLAESFLKRKDKKKK